jgi:hypothetical protein
MNKQEYDWRDEHQQEEKRHEALRDSSNLEKRTREFILSLGHGPAITKKLVEIIEWEKQLSWDEGFEDGNNYEDTDAILHIVPPTSPEI